MMGWNVYILSDMAILSIYVKFQGGVEVLGFDFVGPKKSGSHSRVMPIPD